MYFLLPCLVLGVLGVFFPFVYAVIPAHNSNLCIYRLKQSQWAVSLFNVPTNDLLLLNTIIFYLLNWVFLLAIYFMLYRIRHIKDKLQVKQEMTYTVGVWTVFSIV
jgi:hypothetical protein